MQLDDPTLQVSHETIYTALYAMLRGKLRTELIACPRQARKSRRTRARGTDWRGTIPNMVSIHMRPPEIEDCAMRPPLARSFCEPGYLWHLQKLIMKLPLQ